MDGSEEKLSARVHLETAAFKIVRVQTTKKQQNFSFFLWQFLDKSFSFKMVQKQQILHLPLYTWAHTQFL